VSGVVPWAAAFGLAFAVALSAAAVPLQTLEDLFRTQPSTPVVAALARARLEAGHAEEAARLLRDWAAAHPESRAPLAGTLGRTLYELGDDAAARVALEQALRADAEDVEARVYLALALWRGGEGEPASRVLEEVGEARQDLEPMVRAARALIAAKAGDDTGVRRLFGGRVHAPRADRSVGTSSLGLAVYSGLEIDSNVLLDSGDATDPSADKSDLRARFGAELRWSARPTERLSVQAAYRYDRTKHQDLDLFDLETHDASAVARWLANERTVLEFSAGITQFRLDHASYLTRSAAGLGVLRDLGGSRGVVRLGFDAQKLSFHEDPLLPSLERDGARYALSLQHFVPVPFGEHTRFHWGIEQGLRTTQGGRDLFGLDSAYDHRVTTATVGASTVLPAEITLAFRFSAGRERYANENVVDLISDDGVGDLTPEARRDNVLESRLAAWRPLGRFATVELFVTRTHRISNVDVYDYERTVGGLVIRIATETGP